MYRWDTKQGMLNIPGDSDYQKARDPFKNSHHLECGGKDAGDSKVMLGLENIQHEAA